MNELTPRTEEEILAVYELLCKLRNTPIDPVVVNDIKIASSFKNKKLMNLVANLVSLP